MRICTDTDVKANGRVCTTPFYWCAPTCAPTQIHIHRAERRTHSLTRYEVIVWSRDSCSSCQK